MIPVSRGRALDAQQRELLGLFDGLSPQDRATLLAFAQFLSQRAGPAGDSAPSEPQRPLLLERPASESVVGAIRRLSQTYPMLERRDLLNDTASLMTAHVLHGRPSAQVIDELEALFRERYQRYLDDWSG